MQAAFFKMVIKTLHFRRAMPTTNSMRITESVGKSMKTTFALHSDEPKTCLEKRDVVYKYRATTISLYLKGIRAFPAVFDGAKKAEISSLAPSARLPPARHKA